MISRFDTEIVHGLLACGAWTLCFFRTYEMLADDPSARARARSSRRRMAQN